MSENEFEFEIEGVSFKAAFKSTGLSLKGKAASHTGYRHTYAGMASTSGSKEEAMEVARALYGESVKYPYIVGAEHRDMGWKDLSQDYKTDAWQFRIPQWASMGVTDALEALGMVEACPHNHYWQSKTPISKEEMTVLIGPLLVPGSRLADEELLAAQLLENLTHTGCRVTETQLDLFG